MKIIGPDSFYYYKDEIEDFIEKGKVLLIYKEKNLRFSDFLFELGIQNEKEILNAVWNIAANCKPDKFEKDIVNDEKLIAAWENLPFIVFLKNIDLSKEDIENSGNDNYSEYIYFKISFKICPNMENIADLVCISLHFSEY